MIVWMALYHALVMAWETFWALVLGFFISGVLQVFVSKESIGRLFGQPNLKTISLATVFGAASSSCSYAAAAAARSAFKQGAALTVALAFMFASTNLVAELGVLECLLLGWQFLVANIAGALVLIGLIWLMTPWFVPRSLEEEARRKAGGEGEDDDCCGHQHQNHHASGNRPGRWVRLAEAFMMDWSMLWKEIVIGFILAGALATFVPLEWWNGLFLTSGPAWLRSIENCLVGPLIALASFVCSVGNIPLAAHLWSAGISFGAVISFIFADLIILPLILIYRKYYGAKTMGRMAVMFFICMVAAGIIIDATFGAAGLIPQGPRPPSPVMHMQLRWNYTSWLDLGALALVCWLLWLNQLKKQGGEGRGE